MKIQFVAIVVLVVCSTSYADTPCQNNDFLLGKYSYRKHDSFTAITTPNAIKTVYLQKKTRRAFFAMQEAAKKDKIDLVILSGTRSFWQQKAIWEKKWRKYHALNTKKRLEKILLYSAIPGTSRHHWGTDIDMNSLTNAYFEKTEGKKIYRWLNTHAKKFGFYQVYTEDSSRPGYQEEKWHWSYLPLANTYLRQYNTCIKSDDILGFLGEDIVQKTGIFRIYVNGINRNNTAIYKTQ